MTTGTHDGNLITNQSFVGEDIKVVSGQTLMAMNLADYLLNPLIPTRIKVRVTTSFGTTETEIQNEQEIIIGRQDVGGLRAKVLIESNNVTLQIIQYSSSHLITDVGTIEFIEIDANDRTYNEFKFSN